MHNVITTDISLCQQLLKADKLVAIPTETVYGLAANAFNEVAVRKIFEMKGRPLFNPLIVHIHDLGPTAEIGKGDPGGGYEIGKGILARIANIDFTKTTKRSQYHYCW